MGDPVRANEPLEDPTTPSDPRRPTRSGRRAAPRLALGLVLGPIVGALIGLAIAMLLFDGGTRAIVAGLLGGAIFGGLLGAFWGGMSGLEAVEPEDDPLR
jgi:hypothetical protein